MALEFLSARCCPDPIVDFFAVPDNHEWRQIWLIPAAIAAVVLLAFMLLFKDRGTRPDASLGLESTSTTLEAPGGTPGLVQSRGDGVASA
jgi:hypothetical protein